jgi:glyoxylase-like metal-dependent hydrolase (beta-lactamase superfamily II)
VEAYQIVENVYRVTGGFGGTGENYGGILLNDSPGIVIGASGGETFAKNLVEAVEHLGIDDALRVYFTCITLEEIKTISFLQKYLPNANFYIHEDIAAKVQSPRELYLDKRFDPGDKKIVDALEKKLPKVLDNITHINKMSAFTTAKTKILIVPFAGPHEGHTFIYSRDHRLLCAGVALGYSASNSRAYYLDFTGSIFNYTQALSFLDQAQADIIVPAYDEPRFLKMGPVSTIEIRNAIESDEKAAYELCTLHWKQFDDLLEEYRSIYDNGITLSTFERLPMDATILRFHLSELIKKNKILEEGYRYKRI